MRYRRRDNYKEKLKEFSGDIVINLEEARNKTWYEIFGNDNKLSLEIGMGKGKFLRSLATKNPNNNYVGIEKIEPLLLNSCEKISEEGLDNIKLMAVNANYLEEYFEEKSVESIYLNFSDPWPKNKNANKRLTHKNMLAKYKYILKNEGIIEFKTDNELLFDFSVLEMENFGFERIDYSRNLHFEKYVPEIITTEYEEKFKDLGKNIFFVRFLVKNLEKNEY
ncbi:MAG: tRNA (guanosine(46)-N7)-methyltransferase TrmB [Filifactoraceae bacterium]